MVSLLGCHVHAVLKRMTAFLTTTVTESIRGQQYRFTFVNPKDQQQTAVSYALETIQEMKHSGCYCPMNVQWLVLLFKPGLGSGSCFPGLHATTRNLPTQLSRRGGSLHGSAPAFGNRSVGETANKQDEGKKYFYQLEPKAASFPSPLNHRGQCPTH